MKPCWKITILILLLIAFAVTGFLAESSRPDWRKVSPFTAVEIEEDAIHVEFEDIRYELVSIEQIPTAELVKAAKRRFGRQWEKRIREDIAEVLEGAGFEGSNQVDLELIDSTSGNIRFVPDAEMTTENRKKVYQSS